MPNTRRALSVLLLGLAGWWTIDHQAERATPDERAVLDLVVGQLTQRCLAPATSYSPYGGSGFWPNDSDTPDPVHRQHQASKGRQAVLLTHGDDEQSLLRFAPTPFRRAGCRNPTTLSTPTFIGNHAFVSSATVYDNGYPDYGLYGFERGAAGWQLIAIGHHRAGPVI